MDDPSFEELRQIEEKIVNKAKQVDKKIGTFKKLANRFGLDENTTHEYLKLS